VFTVSRSIGPAPSFAPAASPRLRRRPSPWPPHRHAKPASESTHPTGKSCATPRPLSTRFEPVPRLRSFTTGSSRMPSDPARRTRPVWQSRIVPALSALLPALPDVSRVRLRSAPPGCCDSPARRSCTSLDSQRLTAHQRLVAHCSLATIQRQPRPPRHTPERARPHQCVSTSPADPPFSSASAATRRAQPITPGASQVRMAVASTSSGSALPSGRLNLLLPGTAEALSSGCLPTAARLGC
jgi:hypothetical protein